MDADGSSPAQPLRIVILPWLAFGHLLPNLELAERLASRGHRVSFVTTPGNIALLPPPRAVDLVPLELPQVQGLHDGVENATGAADPSPLKQAFDNLAAPFAAFLAARCADGGSRPDWVIVDTFLHWAAAAAQEHVVPCVMLLPSAPMIAAMGCGARDHAELTAASVFEQMAAVDGGPPAGIPKYEWESNKKVFAPPPTPGMFFARRCSLTLEKCTITAMRGCPEWELEAFPLAVALIGKPVVPLGLVPPSPDGSRTASMDGEHATVRWLDAQPTNSVVYVALGSQISVPVQLVHELALGLELSGTRFLWALRKPSGVPDADILPAGFQERTKGRGLVTMEWVPQVNILGHAAVGAFLTHCGQSSLIEGLQHGHPLIMLPFVADQGANGRVMERRKVGLMVERDDNDGSFDRHGIASAVRSVMVDEESRWIFVENARKMQDVVADKELQEGYIDRFIQQLRSHTTGGGDNSSIAGGSSVV